MQITEILKDKGSKVATVQPESDVGSAVALLREHGVGALVVSADGDSIDGIISERDVVRSLADSGAAALDHSVSSIMTKDVFTTGIDGRTEHLMELMTQKRIRHVPVEADGKLVGIVSIGDVVKIRLAELQNEAQVMEEYIHHGR